MAKGIQIGVSDLHVAKLLTDVDGTGATYDAPEKLAGVLTVGLQPQVVEGDFYADDKISESYSSISSFEITINPELLTPEQEAMLLGKELDGNDGVITTSSSSAPYFAVMFKSLKSDNTYRSQVVYKVKFSTPEETYNTKGDSIEYQTPTINGKAIPRDADDIITYKTDEAIATFMDAVYEPIPVTP